MYIDFEDLEKKIIVRTDKKYEEVITISEWKKDVEEHYSPQNQLNRIDETINFIRKYCEDNYKNKVATFSNLWGYLDVDLDFKKSFKKMLKESMQHFKKLKIKYDTKGKDIIVYWE